MATKRQIAAKEEAEKAQAQYLNHLNNSQFNPYPQPIKENTMFANNNPHAMGPDDRFVVIQAAVSHLGNMLEENRRLKEIYAKYITLQSEMKYKQNEIDGLKARITGDHLKVLLKQKGSAELSKGVVDGVIETLKEWNDTIARYDRAEMDNSGSCSTDFYKKESERIDIEADKRYALIHALSQILSLLPVTEKEEEKGVTAKQKEIIKFLVSGKSFNGGEKKFLTKDEAIESFIFDKNIVTHEVEVDEKVYWWFSNNHQFGYKSDKEHILKCVPCTTSLPMRCEPRESAPDGVISTVDQYIAVFHSGINKIHINSFEELVKLIDVYDLHHKS